MAGALLRLWCRELGSREPGRAHRRRSAQGPETGLQPRALCGTTGAEAPKSLCRKIKTADARSSGRRDRVETRGRETLGEIRFTALENEVTERFCRRREGFCPIVD